MDPQAGGFVQREYLLSPPASTISTSSAHVALPRARAQPLKTGSAKEAELVRYLDERVLHVQRRFAKRGTHSLESLDLKTDVKGYKSFAEAAKDIESLVDLLWISGTPGIQVPYLLSLALVVADMIPALPASPKPTLKLLDKLDLVFASLLQGRNLDTGEPLPGFESGRAVSVTEKVRIKSLVEQTRLRVIRTLGIDFGSDTGIDGDDESSMDLETDNDDDYGTGVGESDSFGYDDVHQIGQSQEPLELDKREISISKVYDRTVVELGDFLGGTPIGIITHD